ncbi:MAG: hypothetical protein ABID38_01375 [Candidatus Diapherotrites archaeon]
MPNIVKRKNAKARNNSKRPPEKIEHADVKKAIYLPDELRGKMVSIKEIGPVLVIALMAKNGYSPGQIPKIIKIAPNFVGKVFRDFKLAVSNNSPQIPPQIWKTIFDINKKLHNSPFSDSRIANDLNVEDRVVHQIRAARSEMIDHYMDNFSIPISARRKRGAVKEPKEGLNEREAEKLKEAADNWRSERKRKSDKRRRRLNELNALNKKTKENIAEIKWLKNKLRETGLERRRLDNALSYWGNDREKLGELMKKWFGEDFD